MTLYCQSYGDIRWFFNGNTLPDNTIFLTKHTNNDTLRIAVVDDYNAGYYECRVPGQRNYTFYHDVAMLMVEGKL